MYSAIKRTIGTAALMLSFIAGPASAFGLVQPITGNGAAVGTCAVSIEYDFFTGTADVTLATPSTYKAGDKSWYNYIAFSNSDIDGDFRITEEQLVACGVSFEAGSLVQRGAIGSGEVGFEAQALMGFGYRETGGQWREYKIGSGTLEPADETAPTVTLTSDAGYDPQVGPFSVLAVFSETIDPTTLAFDTFDVINGEMDSSSFTVSVSRLNPDMTIASFDVTPSNSGVLTVTAPVGFFSDSAGNTNTESGLLEVNVSTAVGLTLTADAVHPFPAPIPVSLAFTNPLLISSIATGDFTVTNGTINEISLPSTGGIASSFDFNVLPTRPGAVTISVAEGVFETYSENFENSAPNFQNNASNVLTVQSSDVTPPTVTLTSNANDPHSGVFTVTATFSEAVIMFAIGDVAVDNGTATGLSGSGTTYTFDVTPTADGAVTVDIAADAADDAAMNGNAAATQLSVTTDGTAPSVTITGPNEVVTEDFTVTFTFSEIVTGFTTEDVTVVNGTKGDFTGSDDTYTLVVSPELGQIVSVSVAANLASDLAGNGNTTSDVFAVQAGSPASEFAAKEDAIRSVITDDAQRSLSSTLASNTRLTRNARGRFLTSRTQMQSDEAGLASRNNEYFDIDGTAVASAEKIATQGMFFAQTGNFEGTQRRLVFGDFDVQRDGDTGSTTATINGKVAWEQMLSEQTMLGYYLGGEVSRSNIKGSFTGTKDAYGVSVGGYFVHALQENLFLDGFASLGSGRNDLAMTDDTLDLTSDYTTQTATLGASVSGVIEKAGYDVLPELSVAYGRTSIDNVGFTGVAYGLTDDTLSLDAGSVSTATIMFRPEFRVPMDGLAASESRSVFSFAPRVMCERVKVASTTNNCGSGAELGISSRSSDGLTLLNTTIIADRVGNSTRRSLQLNLQHKF